MKPDLTPASEARAAIALVVRRYVPEQNWASAGLELREPLEALQTAARATAEAEIAELWKAARLYMRLVEEAASDGSFNPFAHSDMEGFNAAEVALERLLAAPPAEPRE